MALKKLPDPPTSYDAAGLMRWQSIINEIDKQLRDLYNPGHVQGTTMNMTNLPTSSAGLRSGDIWVDTGAANVLKRVP